VQGRDSESKARFEALVAGSDAAPLTAGIEAVYDGRFDFLAFTDGREELYDVAADPDERVDLAKTRPAEVKRLKAILHPPG